MKKDSKIGKILDFININLRVLLLVVYYTNFIK
ncbi:hypothetical protein M2092_001335 [Fusobacterium sp. PH5-44]